MLYRKIKKHIENWIKTSDKALLIDGARQVGKTYLIEQCLSESGRPYVKLDLVLNPSMATALNSACERGANSIIEILSYEVSEAKGAGKPIVFIDEVQKCPELVTMIKALVIDGRYQYVLSGSLLGIALSHIDSQPVGYLEPLQMFPLDFEEFAISNGVSQETISTLKESFKKAEPVNGYLHSKLMELFRRYLVVGGMPEAVDRYISTLDLAEVSNIHNAIVKLYKKDFTQKSEGQPLHLEQVYDLIPDQLSSQNRRFIIASLSKQARSEDYVDDFYWLYKAGVIIPVYNVEAPTLPLKVSESNKLMKVFLNDVGMLTSSYGRATAISMLSGGSGINEGSIYENYVAQELYAHSLANLPPFYFKQRKIGELDFIISLNGQAIPIEVKSGNGIKKHPSLDKIMEVPNYCLGKAYVFGNANLEKDGNVIYAPIYMAGFLDDSDLPLPKLEPIKIP